MRRKEDVDQITNLSPHQTSPRLCNQAPYQKGPDRSRPKYPPTNLLLTFTAGLKMSMNPFCELAVEQSLRLREGKVPSLPVESITAISIGPAKTADTLRTALAMGADKAIHVEVEDDPEPLGVAKVLKAVAEKEKINLILLGKQSIDRDFGQTGQILGGLLGWAQVYQINLSGLRVGYLCR